MLSTPARSRPMALVALSIMIVLTVLMATTPYEPSFFHLIWDKAQHAAAFAILTILAVAAFPSAALMRIGERLSFAGAMIELIQNLPQVHRDCDFYDWVADTLAIIVILLIVSGSRRHRPISDPPG